MKKRLTLILLTSVSCVTFAQVGHGSMSAKPMTDFYNECPTRGYTKEAILETYSTSFRHDGELYMLSYDDKISVETHGKRVPWTNIEMLDIKIYSREVFLFKKREDRWIKWSGSLLKSVTNGFNYIDYGNAGNAFVLDNGWVVIGLNYSVNTENSRFSYPLLILLCPEKSEFGYFNFDDYMFTPTAGAHRRVKNIIKKEHKKYSILMSDDTEITLNFILKKQSDGWFRVFEIKDELGASSSPTTSRFDGEIY